MADGSKTEQRATAAVDPGDAGRLHAGLRQRLRDRGAAGRAAAWARTRRSAPPTGSMPSSCRARPSPRRAAPTSAPGSTASARRCSTRRVQADGAALLEDGAGTRRARPPHRPAALGPGADPEGEARPSSTGMRTMTTAGDVNTQAGMAAHVYLVTQSMDDDYFYNADGEMLIVPQQGALRFFTEFGGIEVEPGEICVIPRGVKFKVELVDGPARGYVCENYGAKFTLPDRGPIGANCLANSARLQDAGRGLRGQGGALPADREVVRRLPRRRDRPLAARRRRLARQLRALQIRPAPLLAGRRHPVRPSRPVDLHGADRAVGDGRHRQRRLRHLPASAGWWPSTPSARPGTT